MKQIGFTIGKFAPFHKGHQYLIEYALKQVDELYIVVYDTDVIDIPSTKRAEWIQTLYPNVKILYAINPPAQYGLDSKSIGIQMEYLANIIGNIPFTHFFSSELYGKYVADYLHIQEVLVDKERSNFFIDASRIREDLEEYKEYLDDIVYESLRGE